MAIPSLSPVRNATLCACLVVAVFCAPSARAQTTYDSFDGAALDDRLWVHNSTLASNWLAGGLLQVSSPNTLEYPFFFAAQDFRSDAEFILDWRDFQPTGSGWSMVQIELGDFANGSHIYYMMRSSGGGPDEIGFFGQVNGVSTGSFSALTSATAGRFRIKRVGSQIDGYYDVGAGWVHLGTFPGVFTADARISIGVHNINHAAFDYLDYTGTPIHPSPDVQVNGSDGPLTVQAGTALDLTLALEANLFSGQPASEFVVAVRPGANPLWYRGALGWTPSGSPMPFRVGPLASFLETSIMTSTAVPPGSYRLYYAVLPASGPPDLRMDSVLVAVQ